MRLSFLGTGTSFGVPVIGCGCAVCRSEDPRNRRRRHALLIEEDGRRLLVDTPPELRLQLVDAEVRQVDAVFLTHPHADHTHGIDDLRVFSFRAERPLPFYVAEEFAEELRTRFSYIWDPDAPPTEGTTLPELDLRTFRDRERIEAAGFGLLPVRLPHGRMGSYGFRAGDLGVLVDAKKVPEDAVEALVGVRVLVVNALWHGHPHPSHFNVEEAVAMGDRLGAEATFLTHMSHRLDHAELEARLPEGVRPAYDGLTVEI